MRFALSAISAALLLACLVSVCHAQAARPAGPAAEPVAAPKGAGVAATVNGQPVSEVAVERALKDISRAQRAQVREEIVNLLIDNLLVEQYLIQMKVAVDEKAVEGRLEEIKAEAKKEKKDFEEKLKQAQLTLDELKGFIRADLRWEAFAGGQADEAKLKTYFDTNKEMFDGSQVRARHILLAVPNDDPKAGPDAVAKLQRFKQQVETEAAAGLAKLPPDADKLAREKERARLVEGSFAALAKKESSCPSKEQGGDVGWFSRAGAMVEPFSRAAYACKPYEITDPVKTQFGYHLILVTERKAGKEAKYEDVKADVKNVYGEKLREAVVVMMRQRAKIEIAPAKP
jgi:parvulin-like peptidyl-prolyl isomerase